MARKPRARLAPRPSRNCTSGSVPPYDGAIEISSNGRPKSRPFCVGKMMTLALHPPFPPMEALSADEVPKGKNWQYEPKWDGFRCLVFRDGRKVELQSKSGQSLTRYFPELVSAVTALKAKRFVLDSEIVVPRTGVFFRRPAATYSPGGE